MSHIQAIFNPINIGKVTLKNRIIMTSMGGTAPFTEEGYHFKPETRDYYMDRVRGGVALIIPFIAGVVALWICDRRYLGSRTRAAERKQKRAARKAAKREEKRLRREEKQLRRHNAAVAYYDVIDNGGTKKEARRARRRVLHAESIGKRERRRTKKEEKRLRAAEARKEKKALARAAREADRAEKASAGKLAPAIRRQKKKAVREAAKAAKQEEHRIRTENRKAAKAARAAERRKKRAEKRAADEKRRAYRRRIAAGGGFAGFISALLSLIVASIIAVRCQSLAPVIPPLYDPISAINEEITAILSGGDVDLNELAKHIDIPELHDRTISFDPVVEWQKPFLTVESSIRMPIYLRHWTSFEYDLTGNAWRGSSTDYVDAYRTLFGKKFSPDEIRTNYYRYLYPTAVNATSFGAGRSFYEAGFASAFVTVSRLEGSDYLLSRHRPELFGRLVAESERQEGVPLFRRCLFFPQFPERGYLWYTLFPYEYVLRRGTRRHDAGSR